MLRSNQAVYSNFKRMMKALKQYILIIETLFEWYKQRASKSILTNLNALFSCQRVRTHQQQKHNDLHDTSLASTLILIICQTLYMSRSMKFVFWVDGLSQVYFALTCLKYHQCEIRCSNSWAWHEGFMCTHLVTKVFVKPHM